MKCVVVCTSLLDNNKIIEKYPIIKNYKYEVDDYPYANKVCSRLLVEIDDLVKFERDVSNEIIICPEPYYQEDKDFAPIEIYDTWRE